MPVHAESAEKEVTHVRLSEKFLLMLKVFLLGAMSGFPQVFVFTLITVWLRNGGYTRASISAFGLITIFYAFNWLFGPFLDRYRALGLDRRRFWMLLTQAVMLIACISASRADITQNWGFILLVGSTLILTFASSIQDVAIDALRIEITPRNHSELLSMGAGFSVAGWLSGFNFIGALGLNISGSLKESGVPATAAWQQVYLILSGFFILSMLLTLLLYRPAKHNETAIKIDEEHYATKSAWFHDVVVAPFRALFTSNGVKITLLLLLFVFLFRLGEAFLGRTAVLFYTDIGFTDKQIATYSKIIGGSVSIILSIVCGLFTGLMRSWKALLISGIAMASTNLLYAVLAVLGPDTSFLAFTIIADNVTTAFATVALIAFISNICSDQAYTGTQYALLASTATFARILLASSGGWMLDHWLGGNWAYFFIMTAVMVIPSLILLWLMRSKFYPPQPKL